MKSVDAGRQREGGRRWLVCFSASLCLPLSSSSSSLRLSLLSLSLWQTEGWWVCCRSNSSIQPRSVGAGSFARWRHTNTTVFPRRDDLVVSVRKQNEARQHEQPPPSSLLPPPSVLPPLSLRPSIRPSSRRLSAMLACMLITHSGRKDNRRVKTNEWSLTIIAPPASRLSPPSGCFCSQMFVVCGFIEMRWNVIDRGGEAKKWPGADEQERDEKPGETWSAQKADRRAEDVSASVSLSLPAEQNQQQLLPDVCAHLRSPVANRPITAVRYKNKHTLWPHIRKRNESSNTDDQNHTTALMCRRRPAVLRLDWTMLKETGSKRKFL